MPLMNAGSSSWSCDECKLQLNGTWYRPDYDLCYSCYKKKLPTSEKWFAYEGAQSSETQCDECKHIINGVKYTVSYDICQPCAQLKPFYSPFNCSYRPTTSKSCPDAVGAIVLRFWPARKFYSVRLYAISFVGNFLQSNVVHRLSCSNCLYLGVIWKPLQYHQVGFCVFIRVYAIDYPPRVSVIEVYSSQERSRTTQ